MKSVSHTPEDAVEDEPAVAPVIAPSNEHNPALENKQADNDDDKHEDQSDEDQQYLTPEEWPGDSPACSPTVAITTPDSDIKTASPYSSPQNASLNGVVQSNAVESGVVQLNREAIQAALRRANLQRHLYHQWPDPPQCHDDSCSCHGPTDIEDNDDEKEEDVDAIEGNDDEEKEEMQQQYDEKEE